MEFKTDLSLELWLRGIKVEGKNKKEAEENLYKMTLQELLDNSYIGDSDIYDVDELVLAEQTIDVEVYNIEYDLSDMDETGYNPLEEEDLPTTYTITIDVQEGSYEEELEELILDQLEEELDAGYPIESFDYKIV